jgi:hypothetical protein
MTVTNQLLYQLSYAGKKNCPSGSDPLRLGAPEVSANFNPEQGTAGTPSLREFAAMEIHG